MLISLNRRAYAIQRQWPTTLEASINPPTLADDPSDPLSHQLNGFIMLANLYQSFDDVSIAIWNKTRRQISPQLVNNLQKQLNDLAQSYACQDSNLQDFGTNQSWLKNTAWQLTNGAGNSTSDNSLSFQYPVDMARDLLMNMASQFPGQGMELMGCGLIEKLIETTKSLTEHLSLQPASRDPFAVGPREHLNQILTVVAMSRHGDNRFLPLLMNKVTDVLPKLVNPMLQSAPENSNMANIDIFDGFGNAGMAQPPQMQMSMDGEYDTKFSVEEYEKQYSLNGSTPESVSNSNSSSLATQTADISGSFVGSPDIMSCKVEYPRNMNGFAVTPMSEIVMSPLGNPGQPSPMNAAQSHHQPPHQQPMQHLSHNSDTIGRQQQHSQRSPQHHMGGMNSQSMSASPMATSHTVNSIVGLRQTSQQQSSFQFPNQPPMRQIGDFHRLQSAGAMRSSPWSS